MTSNADPRAPQSPHESGETRQADGVPDDVRELNHYSLERRLGAGGMGTVYLALDNKLERYVAIKVLPRDRAENPILVKRFRSEAKSAAALRHENIVSVYDSDTANGYLFIVLELVEGGDVQDVLHESGPIDVQRSIDIVRQATLALQHAYERGIVHRDIKPSNLMLAANGVVKLTDMGLARSVDDTMETGITRDGTTVGTVDYMAPEQARSSKAADVRSDLYSLGCTWFHMLTGEIPFPKGSVTNKLMAHATRERPDPRKRRPGIPNEVVNVLHKMMARSPKERYQTPDEVLEALATLSDVHVEEDAAFGERIEEAVRSADPPLDTWAEGTETRSERPRTKRSPKKSTRKSGKKRAKSSQKSSAGPSRLPILLGGLVLIGGLVGLGIWLAGPPAPEPANTTDGTPTGDPTGVVPGASDPPDRPRVRPRDEDPPRPPAAVVDIGRQSEKRSFPTWVAELLSPDDAANPGLGTGLQVVGVGGDGTARADYRHLQRALKTSAGAGGRVIRLNGPGPFVLPVGRPIAGGRHIVVVGDPKTRSLVRLVNHDERSVGTQLLFAGTDLTLVDVDLEVDVPQLETGPALSVRDGDLALRRCSVTVVAGRPTAVCEVAGSPPGRERGPRVLFDRSSIRSDVGTILACPDAAVEVVTWNSLLATREGAVLQLGSVETPGTGTAAGLVPRRRVTFISTTAISNETGLLLENGGGTPAATKVNCYNSIFGTRSPDASLLVTRGWPVEAGGNASTFSLPGLEWTTISSAYSGWKRTVTSDVDGKTFTADGHGGWQRTIESTTFLQQFPGSRWPTSLIDGVASEPLASFSREDNPKPLVRADDGELLGADIGLLNAPDDALSRSAEELSTRPGVPAPFVPPKGSPDLVVEAERDLGRVLASEELPKEAYVVVTGSGPHVSRPILVADRSLRLEFRTDGPEPLVIEVRGDRITPAEKRLGRKNAFITVRNGSVELVNGTIEMPSASAGTSLEWFLHATDSDFALRGTTVQGPVLNVQGLSEMFYFESSSADPPRTAAFADSFAITTSPMLRAKGRGQRLVVENSVLAAAETLFDFDVRPGFDARLGNIVDIRDATLATGDTVFVVRSQRLTSVPTVPFRFFVDATVFGPLPDTGVPAERGPILLAADASVGEQSQIDYRGNDNAFWHGFHGFVVDRDEPTPARQVFDSAWQQPWGSRSQREFVEDGGVRYLDGLVQLKNADRTSFELSPRAKAATWRLDGSAIGADPTASQEPATSPN